MPLEIYLDQSYFYIYVGFTWGIISACGFVCAMLPCGKNLWLNTWTCIMAQKKLPWHWFGVLLRNTGAGCDRDATWVKLLCSSGRSAGSSWGDWKDCFYLQGKQDWCGQQLPVVGWQQVWDEVLKCACMSARALTSPSLQRSPSSLPRVLPSPSS